MNACLVSYDKGQASTNGKQGLVRERNRQGKGQKNASLPKSSIFADVAIKYVFDLHSDVLVFNIFVAVQL